MKQYFASFITKPLKYKICSNSAGGGGGGQVNIKQVNLQSAASKMLDSDWLKILNLGPSKDLPPMVPCNESPHYKERIEQSSIYEFWDLLNNLPPFQKGGRGERRLLSRLNNRIFD